MPKSPLTIAISLLAATLAHAADHRIQSAWPELASHVQGRKISTVLTDGTEVKGRVVSVTPEALLIAVSKTSQPARYRGTSPVPRPLLSSLRVSKQGWKWHAILPVAGAIAIGFAGAVIGGRIDPHGFIFSDGAANGVLVGGIVGATGGYLAARHADRHTLLVDIVP